MWLYHTMGLKKVVDRMASCAITGQFCLWQIHAPVFCPGQNWRARHSVGDRSASAYSVTYRAGRRRALSSTVWSPAKSVCDRPPRAPSRLCVLDL